MADVEALQAEIAALKEALEREKLKSTPQREPSGASPVNQPQQIFVSHDRRIEQFSDKPLKASDVSAEEWIADVRGHLARKRLSKQAAQAFVLDHLSGKAKREVLGRGPAIKSCEDVFAVLLKVFGDGESLAHLQQAFFSYVQGEEEDVVACSLELVSLYDRICRLDPSFTSCREGNLKGRLAEAVKDERLKREL